MKTNARKWRFLFIPPIILLIITALGFVTMWLWNALLPDIFHLPTITFWQAVGLLILSRLLFGGNHWNKGKHPYWRDRMMSKWEKMTPEQREQFRQRLHHSPWSRCWNEPNAEKKDETV